MASNPSLSGPLCPLDQLCFEQQGFHKDTGEFISLPWGPFGHKEKAGKLKKLPVRDYLGKRSRLPVGATRAPKGPLPSSQATG